MKLYVFSVYDSAVECFTQPFCARARGEAVRMFQDLVNDPNNNVGKHPADYALMHLGEFDDKSASFAVVDSPVRIITGLECLNDTLSEEGERRRPHVVSVSGV